MRTPIRTSKGGLRDGVVCNRLQKRNSPKLHEQDIAKRIGGNRQPMSGALHFLKSDVISDSFRLDCKLTSKKSFSVTIEMLEKITMEAFGQDRIPGIQVRFTQDRVGKVDRDWIVLPFSFLEDLIEHFRNIQESSSE